MLKNSVKTEGKDQLDDVYLIRSGNTSYYKIGFSNNFSQRLSRLQTGNPEKLEMIKTCFGGKKLEKSFHEKYGDCRIGGEWFNFDQRTLKSVIEDYNNNKCENTVKTPVLDISSEEKISTTQKTLGNHLEDQTIIPVKRGLLEGFTIRGDNMEEALRIFNTSVPNNGVFSYLSHNEEFITLKRNSPSSLAGFTVRGRKEIVSSSDNMILDSGSDDTMKDSPIKIKKKKEGYADLAESAFKITDLRKKETSKIVQRRGPCEGFCFTS